MHGFEPQFSGPIEGYVTNFLRTNYWRVQHFMEWDDILQEAKFTFVVLQHRLEKNGSVIENERHFMELFKTAWTRHFTTLSLRDTKFRRCISATDFEYEDEEFSEGDFIESAVGDLDNDGQLMCMIEEAPSEVKQVISLMLNAPSEILDAAKAAWRDQGKRGETNRFFCRMLGHDHNKTDLIKMVKDHFSV